MGQLWIQYRGDPLVFLPSGPNTRRGPSADDDDDATYLAVGSFAQIILHLCLRTPGVLWQEFGLSVSLVKVNGLNRLIGSCSYVANGHYDPIALICGISELLVISGHFFAYYLSLDSEEPFQNSGDLKA